MKNKNILLIVALSLFLVIFFGVPAMAQTTAGAVASGAAQGAALAGPPGAIVGAALGLLNLPSPATIAVKAVTGVIAGYVNLVGQLTVGIIGAAITLFQYNNIVNAKIVTVGWNLVRDITNMVFVIMFLVMAFYTVLGKDEYGARKFLVKLVIAAVAVNFSRTIAGLIIDFSQVVMLTFVNGFLAVAGGNFVQAFGMEQFMQIKTGADATQLLGSYMLAAVLTTVMFFVIISMLAMLIARVVMLWLLVILSPFAFVASVLPGKIGSKAGQWWDYFINYNMAGPIMAFFVWLTLYYMNYLQAGADNYKNEQFNFVTTGDTTAFSGPDVQQLFFGFIMSTIMLMIGVKMAAGTKVFGANFAEKGVGYLKKGATSAAKSIGRGGLRGVGRATEGVRLSAANLMAKVPGLSTIGIAQRRGIIAAQSKRIDERQKKFEGAKMEEKLRMYKTAVTDDQKSAIARSILGNAFESRQLEKDNPVLLKSMFNSENDKAKKFNDVKAMGLLAGAKRRILTLEEKPEEQAKILARWTHDDAKDADIDKIPDAALEALGAAGRSRLSYLSPAVAQRIEKFESEAQARPAAGLITGLDSGKIKVKDLRAQDFTGDIEDKDGNVTEKNSGKLALEMLAPKNSEELKEVLKVPQLREAFLSSLDDAKALPGTTPATVNLISEQKVILGGSVQLEKEYSYNPAAGTFKNPVEQTRLQNSFRGDRGRDIFLSSADEIVKHGATGALTATAANGLSLRDLGKLATNRNLSKSQERAIGAVVDHIITEAGKDPNGKMAKMAGQIKNIPKIGNEILSYATVPVPGSTSPVTGGGGKTGRRGGGGGTGGAPTGAAPVSGVRSGGSNPVKGASSSGAREIDLGVVGPSIDIGSAPIGQAPSFDNLMKRPEVKEVYERQNREMEAAALSGKSAFGGETAASTPKTEPRGSAGKAGGNQEKSNAVAGEIDTNKPKT